MAAISYPFTLPGPQKWTIKGTDRRASSELRQPSSSLRTRSRDKGSVVSAEWVYDSTQMGDWKSWFEATLVKGQKWFAIDCPGAYPSMRVARYILSTVRRQNLGNGVFLVSCDIDVRGRGVPPSFPDYLVDLDGIVNAGTSSSVGVSISGLDASATYAVTQPDGRLYGAWSALTSSVTWENGRLQVTTASGTIQLGDNVATYFATPALARASFNARGETITGSTSYRFWILDTPVVDNLGGLSLLIQRV